MRVIPTHDNVLVEVYKEEDKKIGSIIVTDSEERPYERGRVLAVGPGTEASIGFSLDQIQKVEVVQAQVGQEVYFRRGAGCGSPFGRLLKDKDILAVIED